MGFVQSLQFSLMSRSSFALLAIALGAACGTDEGRLSGESEEFGEVEALLTTVPTGVQCVTFTGSFTSRLVTVTAGTSTLSVNLGQLSIGDHTVYASAYNVACAGVNMAGVQPTWIAEETNVRVRPAGVVPVRFTLVPVSTTNNVTVDFASLPAALVAVGNQTYAFAQNGDVRSSGYNVNNQLGDGTSVTYRTSPVAATALGQIASITSTNTHTCAVTAAGALKCWGGNSAGQLGDGTTTARSTPVTVIASGVRKAATGSSHTCALMLDSTVRCTGLNSSGQLGSGDTVNKTSFTAAAIPADSIDIVAGSNHTCVVTNNKAVKCWGANDTGQLGNGTTVSPQLTPSQTLNVRAVVSISAGPTHTCVAQADGGVWCWGQNGGGQLGDQSTTNRSTPVFASLSSGYAIDQVALGTSHTCGHHLDKRILCWGSNLSGQVGEPNAVTFLFAYEPRLGNEEILDVTSGTHHVCARSTSGRSYCWGSNGAGQLGLGNLESHFVPTIVSFQ
jgi:alpha-tubulin suppressor-like RCC1 family protein